MNLSLRYIFSRLLAWRPCAIRNSTIDKTASIGNGAQIKESQIGRYSYAYDCCLIRTTVGAFCSIASKTIIGGGRHPTNWVSSSPVFYKNKNVLKTNFATTEFNEYAQTTIGNDVWIGSQCIIKGGVTIGDGAIIGMGSVVTKDVPPYEIWAGNPAKFIRKRFDNETITKLLDIAWWNWDKKKLLEYGEHFNNPSQLFEKLEEAQ